MSKDSNPPISVLLIDDHILVRQGLRMLIENNPDIKVVGEAGTCAKALEVASEKLPDIVLLDLDLGGDSGLNIIPQLVSLHEKMHVLILTGVREPELHRRAIRLGAVGIIMKENAGEVLVKAIRRVHAGEVWIDRGTTAVLFQEMRRGSEIQRLDTEAARIASLTPREKEVVALIARGVGSAQIAKELFISEKTVRNHLVSIFDKLRVSSRLELSTYAALHGLVSQQH